MHNDCLVGANTWCQLLQVVKKISSTHLLFTQTSKHILPIYWDLPEKSLLERCLGRHTQNRNESFSATVWRLALKHLHAAIKIVEISAYLAAGIFNEGYHAVLRVMNALVIKVCVGQQWKFYADLYDNTRLTRQERCNLNNTKRPRTARKLQQIEQNELYEKNQKERL